MNDKDKFNILYNEIKLMKKERNKIENNKEIEEMKNKINELNINMKKREEDIKDILDEKDKIIKEMNEKIIKQDNEINEIKMNDINELINKRINEIENKLFNDFNKNMNDIKKNLKNEINIQNIEIDNKLKDNVNKINIIENKYDEIIKYKDLINNIEKEIEKINKEKEEYK